MFLTKLLPMPKFITLLYSSVLFFILAKVPFIVFYNYWYFWTNEVIFSYLEEITSLRSAFSCYKVAILDS